MLAWAAWQLQFSTTACGTLRKHVTKPSPQPAAPDCTVVRNATTVLCTKTFLRPPSGDFYCCTRPHPSWKKKLRIQFSGQPSRELSLVLHINRRLSTGRRNVFRRSLMTILTIYADLTPGQELRGVQADDAGGSRATRV